MKEPNFWDDKRESERVISNINSLKNTIDKVKDLKEKIINNFEIVEELKNSYDEELLELVSNEINNIKNEIDDVEVLLLLS